MFNTKEMFNLGFAFLNAGEVNFIEGTIKHRSEYQNVAGFVNLAFACELFIKCLLNMSGRVSREHKLDILWNEYKVICLNDANTIESAVMNRLVTDMHFDDMLSDDSNIFYNYRYLYEPDRIIEIRNNPLRPQFLRVFAFELYNHLHNEFTV